jgi:MoxR-like ATPase
MMYQFCKNRKEGEDDPKAVLRDSIITGRCQKMSVQMQQPDIKIDGLLDTFSKSQKEAVVMALQEPLSIIWGPPGCGKTLVVTAIVANWIK